MSQSVGLMADHSKGFSLSLHVMWSVVNRFSGGGKLVLVIFSLFGFVFFDAVYIMAIINYAIQSELNIYLLHALRIKVERREHKSLDAAIKVNTWCTLACSPTHPLQDINKANAYLKVLNGKTATAVALIMFNLATAALDGKLILFVVGSPTHLLPAGVIVLGDNTNSTEHTVVATFTAVLWSLLVVFPFMQVMSAILLLP